MAAAIIAVPIALFGFFELLAHLRRRRERRLAQRPKGPSSKA